MGSITDWSVPVGSADGAWGARAKAFETIFSDDFDGLLGATCAAGFGRASTDGAMVVDHVSMWSLGEFELVVVDWPTVASSLVSEWSLLLFE